MPKSKFDVSNPSLYLTLLLFHTNTLPELYLIPATAWNTSNDLFVDRDYDKPGQTSKPEYGLNLSKKNKIHLEPYRFQSVIPSFLGNPSSPLA